MILWIGLAGAMGSLLRYLLGKMISSRLGTAFPWGTCIINVTGSLILGLLYGAHQAHWITEGTWVIWGTGFCGAYTTFSTFGYETLALMGQEKYGKAIRYVISSVLLGVLGCVTGVWWTA